jgi:hypothetical protein
VIFGQQGVPSSEQFRFAKGKTMPTHINPQVNLPPHVLRRLHLLSRITGETQEELVAACLEKALPIIGVKLDVYLSVRPEEPRRWTPWPGSSDGGVAQQRRSRLV